MELPKSGIALAIICMVCGSAESCGQGRRAVYCKNRQHVDYPAFLCAGVKPTHCPQYAIKCACPKNLYRRSDGNCVQEKDCATTTDGQGEVDETARPPFKMPETFVKSDLSTRSRSFVRRPEILEIVMAAFDSWTDSECVCIKSKFLETTENGSRRSFGCYKYAIVLGAPPALEHTIGTKAIIMVTEDIDIDVEYKGGYTTMTLVPAAQPSDVQDSYDPEFDLLGKYWILAVDDDCLLVAFASDTNGKLKCILWSVEGDQDKNETNCFLYLNSWCPDMYDVWDHNAPCSEYDKKMKRQEELALQEKLRESG